VGDHSFDCDCEFIVAVDSLRALVEGGGGGGVIVKKGERQSPGNQMNILHYLSHVYKYVVEIDIKITNELSGRILNSLLRRDEWLVSLLLSRSLHHTFTNHWAPPPPHCLWVTTSTFDRFIR